MCNFMGIKLSQVEYIKVKQIEKELGTVAAMREAELMKDGFRYSNSPIVRKVPGKDDIEVVPAHWELIPVWIQNMDQLKEQRKKGIPFLNATAEKLLESKMFRDAALKRRCLVLATHFFEWRHYKPAGAKKDVAFPYSIEVKDQNYFYMAGIWQPWTDKSTGEHIDTFAIVTTKANSLMAQVHNKKNRMPTILTDDLAWEWILGDLSEDRIREIAAFQIRSAAMVARPIRKDFKLIDDPCEEFTYAELPELETV